MKTFVDYYNANKKRYTYTLKIAQNDFTVESAAKLEQYLEKYNLVEFKPFKKTPIQQNPLDFPNAKNSEVYITDVVVEYPITPNALQREVSSGLGISEGFIVIYAENDPRHQYTEEWLERMTDKEKFKSEYKPKLGNLEQWGEEPAYGNEYNLEFLKSLQKVSDKTKTMTNSLIPEQEVEKVEASKVEFDGEGVAAVLNDRHRNATEYKPRKNTLMSKPVEETKKQKTIKQ